jgi:vesicle-fusing ATPase
LFIGIKKLLGMIDMAKQIDEERRVIDFLSQMESEGFLELGA